ncbi:Fc.00g098320.m01.CDS01 [Cosmosporella sp. VM-42]
MSQVGFRVHELKEISRGLQSRRSKHLKELLKVLGATQSKIQNLESDLDKKYLSSDEIEILTTNILELSGKAETYAKEHDLLRGIDYEHRPARHEKITDAHEKTFGWVFHPSGGNDQMQGQLLNWLSGNNGIFWVSGKPGSGKSTLMKFIAEHSETRIALTRWSGSKNVVIASHYFWYAGSPIQKSLEGLLRSLLFDILRQAPEMIPVACPERWLSHMLGRSAAFNADSMPWTLAELQKAISTISCQNNLSVNFCFFIDGLDEFNGEHSQICEMLVALCGSPNIKMCISARPWNVFEDNIGRDPTRKLYVHELTREDIRNYVEAQLCEHTRWATLLKESHRATLLVNDITDRAQGVFLWVFMVTRLLREGLTNYDTLSDLQRRLEAVPSDLESFFRHMMESVEPFYHEKMAGTLQIAITAQEPLPLAIYRFHDLEYEEEHYALKEAVEPWDCQRLEDMQNLVSRRLNARCKGLLEINGTKVEFLHRTVCDFLRTKDMGEFISKRTRQDFDPYFSIFQAYVAWIKHARFYESGRMNAEVVDNGKSRLTTMLLRAFSYARQAKAHKHPPYCCADRLLDDLEVAIQRILRIRKPNTRDQVINDANALFRSCALRAALDEYIRKRVEQFRDYFVHIPCRPLEYVLHREVEDSWDTIEYWPAEKRQLLQCLLCQGQNPNRPVVSNVAIEALQLQPPVTPWVRFADRLFPALKVTKIADHRHSTEERHVGFSVPANNRVNELLESLHHGVLKTLLEYDADPNSLIPGDSNDYVFTYPVWARYLFLGVFSLPRIAEEGEVYLQNLECMLSRADLSRPQPVLLQLMEDMLKKPSSVTYTPAFSLLTKQSGRKLMMEIICLHLDELLAESTDQHQAIYRFQDYKLKAKAISLFIKKAKHPSVPMYILESRLRRVFPEDILSPKVESPGNPFFSDNGLAPLGYNGSLKRSRNDYESLDLPVIYTGERATKLLRIEEPKFWSKG